MHTYLLEQLQTYTKKKGPIRVCMAGIGYIANGIIVNMSTLKEEYFFPAVIIYRTKDKVERCIEQCERPYQVRYCETVEDVHTAVAQGEVVAITDYQLAYEANIDLVADLTGDAAYGAELAYETLSHSISMVASPEIDICLGHYFAELAADKNVVYTGFSGDEPGEIRNLTSYVSMTGLEVTSVGKFKNFIDKYASPTSVKKWADMYHQSPIKLSSFADGTKMNIEMGITANSIGFVPDTMGMHMPQGTLDTVTSLMALKEDGGVLDHHGVIDIVRGVEPSGGIFVIGYSRNEVAIHDMVYYKMGKGPYYMFYKPYHLCSFEMLMGFAKAVVLKSAVIKPLKDKKVDVLVFAKKDLKAGEVLDDIGGYTFYGLLEDLTKVSSNKFLPVSLATGCTLCRDLNKDELITIEDIVFDETTTLGRLIKKVYNL